MAVHDCSSGMLPPGPLKVLKCKGRYCKAVQDQECSCRMLPPGPPGKCNARGGRARTAGLLLSGDLPIFLPSRPISHFLNTKRHLSLSFGHHCHCQYIRHQSSRITRWTSQMTRTLCLINLVRFQPQAKMHCCSSCCGETACC